MIPIFSRTVLFLTLAAALSGAQTQRHASNRSISSKPDILLVTIDTVRADHVGCYGAHGASTPTIDALAADGIRFEHAISQVPLTWPSHASLLTGTYPFHNGVQDFTGQPLSAQFRTLAEVFHDHGYATAAVVSSFVLDRTWGLARGFDSYDDAFAGTEFLNKDLALVERPAKDSVDRAISWLAKPRSKPFFLWLHLYDPHSPYNPPEPFRSRFKEHLYDGEIAYADSEVGRLIAWLNAHGRYSNTAVILTSDHGESLGDHGEKEHGFFIYDSTVRVPLVVKLPNKIRRREKTIEDPVELTAIAPTLLKIAGLSDVITKQFDSASLLSPRQPNSALAYSETFYPFSSFGWSPLRGLRSERFRYVQAPRPELYDIGADPAETRNLVASSPPMLPAMQQKLQELANTAPRSTSSATAASDPSVQDKLRALGYVGYAAPHKSADLEHLADPKDKVTEYQAILAAADAFNAGEYERGAQLLKSVEQSDPEMYLVPFMLGEAALRKQDWAQASAQFTRALQLNPGFDQAMTGAARALYRQGEVQEARSWLKKALEKNDKNFRAWYELGWLEMSSNPQRAADAFNRTITLQPNFAPAYRDLGVLRYQEQEYTEAALNLKKAANLGLQDSKLLNFLGICYSRTRRLQEAIESYRGALKLDPDLAEAHLNLGFAYQRLDRSTEANAEYRTACRLEQKFCSMVPDLRDERR